MIIKDTNISEIDIFNFVFFNDSLSDEEKKAIESNKDYYGLIEFYKNQKEELDKSIKDKTKKKLAKLIPAYKLSVK